MLQNKRIFMERYFKQLVFCFVLVGLLSSCAVKQHEKSGLVSTLTDLKKEYHIKFVAPASNLSPKVYDDLNQHIRIPEKMFDSSVLFHSNTDNLRYKYLKDALFSKHEKQIIWCLRGGYGSARIIDMLDMLPPPQNERIFIGYSDITALHLFLSQKWGWKTIHGAMIAEIIENEKNTQNFQKLFSVIRKKSGTITFGKIRPLNNEAKKLPKDIIGHLTGGNMTTVQTSIGTSWEIQTKDKILFLEDVGEKGYTIDRMLNHFKQSGKFQHVKAVIFGDFGKEDELVDIGLKRFAKNIGIPVYKTENFGHGNNNYPIVYNSLGKIDKKTYILEMQLD